MQGVKIIFGIVVLMLWAHWVSAQSYYWIGFTDKKNTPYSLEEPHKFLSQRSIERRQKQHIPIDSLDLPVDPAYVDSVKKLGVLPVHQSKWLNGVTVATLGSFDIDRVLEWSFVREVQLTKPGKLTKSVHQKFEDELSGDKVAIDTSYYGPSVYQVGMLNGQFLHNKGYRGAGMQIAVIDAGFFHANQLPAFDSLWNHRQILGTRDLVESNSDIFETDSHGMSVLSCMGGNIPGKLVGTAPEAAYWLLRSEDASTEYVVEEDHWVAAAEYADSVGADIITSSLGYSVFDDPATNHSFGDMDGQTTRITKAANVAASKGMLVLASAGNERDNYWQRIVAPADGDGVIAVGAVDKNGQITTFSSAGPASDGDIKPNVSAMGGSTVLQWSNGQVGTSSGTSFSCPIMAGMLACLWQMFPEKTASEIKLAVEMSSDRYQQPDSLYGYGIPDMQLAAQLLGYQGTKTIRGTDHWKVFPNPVIDQLVIDFDAKLVTQKVELRFFTVSGLEVEHRVLPFEPRIQVEHFSEKLKGPVILQVLAGEHIRNFKLIFSSER